MEEQSLKYRTGLAEDFPDARYPLPFSYETTGIETRFTSYLDADARSRPVFNFHRPETLARWLEQVPSVRDAIRVGRQPGMRTSGHCL